MYDFQWLETTGSMHCVAPMEVFESWNGLAGDFMKASALPISSPTLEREGVDIFVLGDLGMVSWIPELSSIVMWIGADDDKDVDAALRDRSLWEQRREWKFRNGAGPCRLFESGLSAADLAPEQFRDMELPGGELVVRYHYIGTNDTMLGIWEFAGE